MVHFSQMVSQPQHARTRLAHVSAHVVATSSQVPSTSSTSASGSTRVGGGGGCRSPNTLLRVAPFEFDVTPPLGTPLMDGGGRRRRRDQDAAHGTRRGSSGHCGRLGCAVLGGLGKHLQREPRPPPRCSRIWLWLDTRPRSTTYSPSARRPWVRLCNGAATREPRPGRPRYGGTVLA